MMFGRKQKKYARPKKLYDKQRIEAENELVKRYGLKNKREIWKADATIEKIRRRAKMLITAEPKKQEEFLEKLRFLNFNVEKIADVLGLNKEDWLRRRLQTVVFDKKIANTPKHARQLIVHKHIAIGETIVNKPSYPVSVEEEAKIRRVKNG